MQEWPQKFEEFLTTIDLPGADLDCSLTEYVDIVCGEYGQFCIVHSGLTSYTYAPLINIACVCHRYPISHF